MINLQAETQREQSQLTQNMCRQIAQDMQKQSDKVREWYDEFMSKVNTQNKVVVEELDRIRGRIVSAETADINLQQKLGDLFTQSQVQDKQLQNFDKWSVIMQKQLDTESLELTKIRDITDGAERMQKSLDRMNQELEYNQNHYMLIENYVEKYIPITVQEAISNNLKSFLKHKDQEQLDYYIKSRRKELHGVVLDNEDMPDVVNKINAIRLELGRIPFPNRQFPNKDGTNSDVQSSTFMQSNSMMSRAGGFFAFQGGRHKGKRQGGKSRIKHSHSNTDTTSMEGSHVLGRKLKGSQVGALPTGALVHGDKLNPREGTNSQFYIPANKTGRRMTDENQRLASQSRQAYPAAKERSEVVVQKPGMAQVFNNSILLPKDVSVDVNLLQSKLSQPDSLSRESNAEQSFTYSSPGRRQPMVDYSTLEKAMKIDEIDSPVPTGVPTGGMSKKSSIKINRSMDHKNTELKAQTGHHTNKTIGSDKKIQNRPIANY